MCITIKTKNIMHYGEKRILVEAIEALTYSDLPTRYLDGPAVYRAHTYLWSTECTDDPDMAWRTNVPQNETDLILMVGEKYTEAEFEKKVAYIKKCGERLRDCNKEIERERREWENIKTTIEI